MINIHNLKQNINNKYEKSMRVIKNWNQNYPFFFADNLIEKKMIGIIFVLVFNWNHFWDEAF